MSEGPRFYVIDGEGVNLFHIDYVPPIGSTLHYYVDWRLLEYYQKTAPEVERRSDATIEVWRSIDGKYWTVKDVYCECRNYGNKRSHETLVHFVEVIPKITPPQERQE